MNIKKRIIDVSSLAISVGFLVPIWGSFHSTIGITLAWPAFVSAAIFFAMGHIPSDAPKVILGHLLGVIWGICFYSLINIFVAQHINQLFIPVLVLWILGIGAVIVTHIGIDLISHLPSLFSGWAVAVATLSGVTSVDLSNVATDTSLSLCIGIGLLGIGIPVIDKFIKRFFNYIVYSKSSKKIDHKLKSTNSTMKDNGKENKMDKYIIPYRQPGAKKAKQSIVRKELSDIKNEIIRISKFLPSDSQSNKSSVSQESVSIVGVCGSPHKNGSTIAYMKKILEAAESMGRVNTKLITVAGKDIKPCMGCKTNSCYGECKIKDDMQDIYPVLRNADGIIIGSPSYFGTFSGQLKLLIDRLRVMRHTNFQLANKVIAPLGVAGRRHGGQEITNLDIMQAMMRHNTIIVNDGTAVCQLGATGWSHTFDDPSIKPEDDLYGFQTCEGVGRKVVEIARAIKNSGVQHQTYEYHAKVGKR